MGRGEGLQQNNLEGVLSWLQKEDSEIDLGWFRFLRYSWPVLSIGAALACWYYDRWSLFTPVAFIAWSIVGKWKKKTDEVHKAVSGQQEVLSRFSGLFAALSAAQFQSPLLQALQQDAQEATVSLKKLAKITERFDARKNILGSIVLNTFSLYDLGC